MKRQTLTGCAAIAVSLAAAAISTASSSNSLSAANAAGGEAGPTENEVRDRANALLSQMTPEEKAGQLGVVFALPIPQMTAAVKTQVAGGKLGALLFATDPKEINQFQRIAVEQSRLKIPLLFGFDVIHGLSTILPVPIAMAASWDPAFVTKAQGVAAGEARRVGLHWTFAPMVDIARDPRWGRIVEGAGEDPFLGSAMAAAQVRGLQGPRVGSANHIIAGPKHFVAYGAALGGRDYDEVNVSDSELWNVYLPPFKAAIDAGAGNVMTAYMGVNGIPAAGNRHLVTDLLRTQLGFKGWVVSDNEAVKALTAHGLAQNDTQAAARALSAGVDMEMALFAPATSNLPKAIAQGLVSQEQVDNAVRRVLEAKIRMGLFEKPYVQEEGAASSLRTPANLTIAREAAERAAVLLKNENALLPLDKRKIKSIAVIGSLADSSRDMLGPWVFDQNKPAQTSVLQGLKAKLGSNIAISYAPGVELPKRLHPSPFASVVGDPTRPSPTGGDAAGIEEAVANARKADVAIVVVGETESMIGESASRSSLDLPGRQQELLDAVVATGKPVVVLIVNGRPLSLGATSAAAVLDIWYPGSQAGPAVANLLFGEAVPGGKLPFTWPRNVGQVPMIYAHLTSHDPKGAQKRYWNESNSPTYPFGYGLSYTSFAYSVPRLDRSVVGRNETLHVSVDVKNIGARAGDEVAQLYLRQRFGSAARPVRELKGFQRLTLKPGEVRTVTFRIGSDELRYWNAASQAWVIDPSTFDVAIGGDSTAEFGANFSTLPGAP